MKQSYEILVKIPTFSIYPFKRPKYPLHTSNLIFLISLLKEDKERITQEFVINNSNIRHFFAKKTEHPPFLIIFKALVNYSFQ
jgi:hypothetical protein